MSFIKKYPIFTALLVVLLLIFATQVYFVFSMAARTDSALKGSERSARTLESYLQSSPAPTQDNLKRAESNVGELQDELRQRINSVRGQIESSVGQDVPGSASDMLFELQSFVDRYNALARAPGDELDPIQLPGSFGFSFRALLDSGVPPDDEYIPDLWKQKEIIQYLMDALYASGPISITAVEREALTRTSESSTSRGGRNRDERAASGGQGIFSINPLISARVPGAVETMAFRVQFTGYTGALREFLARLSSFELPVVVRSVEVSPAPAGAPQSDDLFGGIFGSRERVETTPEDDRSRRPVVVDNISRFTVVVEFIQVVLEELAVGVAADAAETTEESDL